MSHFDVTVRIGGHVHDCLAVSAHEPRGACPRDALWHDVTNKWAIQVIASLAEAGDAPVRFGKLRRRIAGVSPKVLSETLRALERDGLVSRHEHPGYPSHVEYRLTPMGAGFLPALDGLARWISAHAEAVERARAAFDAR